MTTEKLDFNWWHFLKTPIVKTLKLIVISIFNEKIQPIMHEKPENENWP